MGFFSKMFGSYSDRELKSIYPIVDKIEAMADEYKAMSDAELQAKTPEFKTRLQSGETLDDILPEAFATVREASRRVLGLYPYRVQLVGGVVLHQGRIAEMKTGEGKTLVATLPAYLNALTGNGVHIVTVNDYLAKRDSEWMGKVHRFLGLTVGLVGRVSGVKGGQDGTVHHTALPDDAGQVAGVDALDADGIVFLQKAVQRLLTAPVGGGGAGLTHNVALGPDAVRLHIVLVHAVVADEGIGLGDDLAVVAGVGQGLFKAHHTGGKDNFAHGNALSTH